MPVLADYLTISKPRIVLLVTLVTYASMWLARGSAPPLELTAVTLVGTALVAASALSLNCAIDQDIDQIMPRTRHRPTVQGRLSVRRVLVYGIILGLVGVSLLLTLNLLAVLLALVAHLFYLLVYTAWLKRRSVWNTVIGGVAGALPPLIGWAAVTGTLSLEAACLFAVMFLWQPPHFWALTLYRGEDYAAAGLPMLPVVRGLKTTYLHILAYTAATVLASLLFALVSPEGWLYLVLASALGVIFLALGIVVSREQLHPRYLFKYSSLYAALLFLSMIVGQAS